MNDSDHYIILAENLVQSSHCNMIALLADKTATSSSQETWSGSFRYAFYGNDLIATVGIFFETRNTLSPWWRCDLERTHAVTAFNLVYTQDSCNKYTYTGMHQ